MQIDQIRNEIYKACQKTVCSNSPLGCGNKKRETLKAFDELVSKIYKIYNS